MVVGPYFDQVSAPPHISDDRFSNITWASSKIIRSVAEKAVSGIGSLVFGGSGAPSQDSSSSSILRTSLIAEAGTACQWDEECIKQYLHVHEGGQSKDNLLKTAELETIAIPFDLEAFIKTHEEEIRTIVQTKRECKKWKLLDSGTSKKVFVHPEMAGYVLKIPFWNSPLKLFTHHSSLNLARDLIKEHRIEHVIVPESKLLNIGAPALIEQKFDLIRYDDIPEGLPKQKAENEFRRFLELAKICDVYLSMNLNAGFLLDAKSKDQPIVVAYDLDCTY